MEESVKKRIQAMVGSQDRTEMRLTNELVTTVAHYKGWVKELVREGKKMAASLRKRMESLEASKNNELSSLKEIHLSVMETTRRGHEREVEKLKRRHDNEIMALKEAHSHTRMLSELSLWMKTLLQNVSHLQARFGNSREWHRQEHGWIAGQRSEAGKSETSKEQERLHSLIAMLETELKAQQSDFETIEGASLQRILEYWNQLQQAKEKFFKEQKTVLPWCYAEKQALSNEWTGVADLEKTVRDREHEKSCRKMQIEAKEPELLKRHQKLSSAGYGMYSLRKGSDVILLTFMLLVI